MKKLGGICEVHYSGTLGDGDAFYAPGRLSDLTFGAFDIDRNVSDSAGGLSLVNLTAGLHYEIGCGLNGRVAGVVPLSSGREALFPFELVVQTDFRF